MMGSFSPVTRLKTRLIKRQENGNLVGKGRLFPPGEEKAAE